MEEMGEHVDQDGGQQQQMQHDQKDDLEALDDMDQHQQQNLAPLQQTDDRQLSKGDKHYYDSIETEEFIMPNMFEVEIRLADNQVIPYCLTPLDQNCHCRSRKSTETKAILGWI
jgi:hypothetical protein